MSQRRKSDDEGPPEPSETGYDATRSISGEESDALAKASTLRIAEGEVVASRYRIVRYLARGGMGEVYEAEDLELGERVALKTIREEAQDPVAEERFKREIQLSRKVTHPNVCRIFDVGFHERPGQRTVVFLTMELLPGRTLQDRIKQEGPLGLGEAAGIVRQICAGLSAAHEARVIHRDLKTANVLLAPRGSGVRAVVTDFGLAHLARRGFEQASTLSGSGGIVGTPAYMAPEQVDGGELGPTTDVYALGVVIYEMLTGELPFDGPTPLAIAAKRLTSAAPSPKKLRPELPARWERATLACLERDPSKRPATPRAVLELLGLTNDSFDTIEGTVQVPQLPRRVPLLRPALVLLAISIALVGIQRWRATTAPPGARAVAVLPLAPRGAAAQAEPGIGEIAAELIRNQLSTVAALDTETADSIGVAIRDVSPDAVGAPSDAQIDRLRALLAVDLFTVGEYELTGDGSSVRFEARLVDARSRRTLGTTRQHGSVDQLGAMLEAAGLELGRAAGGRGGELRAGVTMTLPRNPTTLHEVLAAKTLLLRADVTAAVAAGQRAVAAEPDYARAHLVLAEASRSAGNERTAATEAKRALELAGALPRRERAYVEAFANSLARDHAAAITRFTALRTELPNDRDIAMMLADELVAGRRAQDALALVTELRKQVMSPLVLQRLELIEASAAEAAGDLERSLRAAQRAVETAAKLELKNARARARYFECHALDVLNRIDAARAACEDCRRIAAETGERRQRAVAVNIIAWIDFLRGERESAERAFRELIPIFRDIGDVSSESMVLNNLANIASMSGDSKEAKRLLREALALGDQLNNDESVAAAMQNLAGLLSEEGNLDEALQLLNRAEVALKGSEMPTLRINARCRTAGLLLEMGRGREADGELAEIDAELAHLTSNFPGDEDCDLLRAEVESAHGRAGRGADLLRETMARMEKMGSRIDLYALSLSLALSLEDAGDLARARATASAAASLRYPETAAGTDRSYALLRLRLDPPTDHGYGRKQLEEIAAAIKADPNLRSATEDAISLEWTRAALGGRDQAIVGLKALAARCAKDGFVALGLSAERIVLHLERQAGRRPSAATIASYATRARTAGRPGWAEQVERLSD